MTLENLIRAWQVSEGNDFNCPAAAESLNALEQHLGQALPPEIHALYGFSDGCCLVRHNLNLWPVGGDNFSLWESTKFLRDCGHIFPDEVLVFGDNGGDELFGIWLPTTDSNIFQSPVVEIGSIFEPGCMAVAGTSLLPFLIGRTAFYLLTDEERPAAALDELGLPEELRFDAEEMEDAHFARLIQWADPQLPEPNIDSYKSRYDSAAIKKLFLDFPLNG